VTKKSQDFEQYAVDRPMRRNVSAVVERAFDAYAPARPLKVLDHGCGDGTYFSFLAERYGTGNIFGCDVSALRIQRCQDAGWSQAMVVDPEKPLPYDDGTFDLILSDQVIEHIPVAETFCALSELARVLKAGGLLLMITPNYPVKRVYDAINSIVYRDLSLLRDDQTHVTFYDARRLSDVLQKHFTRINVLPTGGLLYSVFPAVAFSHKLIAVAVK
jgi:SAM-dependent methyltransferase